MSVTAQPPLPAAPRDGTLPESPIYRLSVAQYHAMARAGILTEDDPVELLEGWLVRKMTKNPPHAVATRLLREAVRQILPSGWLVDSQEPITTGDSEPEPDVWVARGSPRDFQERHPGPNDLALVVEIADTSLGQDRGTKKRLYARARIEVYWIVNLLERRIEAYSDPSGPTKRPDYRKRTDYGEDERVPLLINGSEVGSLAVVELLPGIEGS